MTRLFTLLSALALLAGCARQPPVKSGVDLEQLIKGKSPAAADSHEAIPNTYFELTAWTGDDAKAPPTVLSPTGTEKLFDRVRALKARGVTVILILHKIREVLAVADTVSILRNGRLVGAGLDAASIGGGKLAAEIIGSAEQASGRLDAADAAAIVGAADAAAAIVGAAPVTAVAEPP